MGREAKLYKNKLTRKQVAFIKGVASGRTPTESAMEVYNAKSKRVATSIASENLTKPSIREAIDNALSSQGLSLSVIMGNLGEMANSKPERISGDTKLKANMEILKLIGAYPDKKTVGVSFSLQQKVSSMTFEEVRQELEKITKENQQFLAEIRSNSTHNI